MVDLSVKIGDITLQNPVQPASGAFSWEYNDVIDLNRLGALVAKTICREPRLGNPTPRMAETEAGIIQSIGLPGKGIEYFIEHIVPEYAKFKPPLVVSVLVGKHRGFRGARRGAERAGRRRDRGQHLVPDPQPDRRQLRDARGLHPRLHHRDPRQDQEAAVGEALAQRRRHRLDRARPPRTPAPIAW